MAGFRKEDVRTEADIVRYLSDWSDFEKAVYVATFKIPEGEVSTYHAIAKMIGKPNACRAVANALHNNPLYPTVPCWRVIKSDGGFGGDKAAAARRRARVRQEGVPIENGKVVMSDALIFPRKIDAER